MFRSSVVITLIRMVAIAVTLGLNVLITRFLGAGGAGTYYMFIAALAGLSVLSKYGFDLASIRILVQATKHNDSLELQKGYVVKILTFVMVIATLITIVLGGLGVAGVIPIKNGLDKVIMYATIGLIPYTALLIQAAILRGMKNPVKAACFETLLLPLFTMIGLFVYLYSDSLSVDAVMRSFICSATVIALLVFLFLQRNMFGVESRDERSARSLLWIATPMLIITACTYLGNWSTTWVLATFGSKEDVGIFNICWRIVAISGFLQVAFNNVNAPYFAADYANSLYHILQDRVYKSSAILVALTMPVLIGLYIFSRQVLAVFGDEFVDGYLCLRILIIAQAVSTLCGSVGYLLMMGGHEAVYSKINTYTTIGALFLCLFLVIQMGILGAAIATATGMVLKNVIAWIFVRKLMNVTVLPRWVKFIESQ